MTVTINGSTGISGVDGSAATPALQGGDTNTGIYFPAADNIGFTTGGTIRGRWTTDGLCFNADTAAVNALDDYEEGTWTPTVAGSSTAGTATYSENSGRYTKIGRLVQIELYLAWSSGTGTGDLRIQGLPFTAASSNTYPAGIIAYLNNLTLSANHIATAMILSGSTTVYIRSTPVGGGAAGEAAYDASASIIMSASYSV